MIRAFISTWSIINNDLITPIETYFEDWPTDGPRIWIRKVDPIIASDGIPVKSRVLVLVDGPPTIEQLSNLTGVMMIPPYRFDKPISEIPESTKTVIKNAIVAEGIPLSALSGMIIYGDFINKVAKYFWPDHEGFGSYLEVTCAGDFE